MDAQLKIPIGGGRELAGPFPGLRSFYEHERPMFFGRGRQVDEIIERLTRNHFVSILGGSGSGKSSIVRAGVIPELRSFAIEDQGDLWIPVTVTPGTSPEGDSGPIQRLADKLAEQLVRGSVEPAPQAEIAGLLRQPNGLSIFLERFAGRLNALRGRDPGEGNLLIVIDQFEEIFHHRNQNERWEDCQHLVERILDTFPKIRKQGVRHPRLFLVLTMRTEFLDRCIAYEGLPDAMNRGGYLIGRLSTDEIRNAIVEPPLRYLRLLASSCKGSLGKPPKLEISPDFVTALVEDCERVQNDADQLPLLQHALFWAWNYACEDARARDLEVPDSLDASHLCGPERTRLLDCTGEYDERASIILRPSLDKHADYAYLAKLDPNEQRIAEALFRRLALLDPRTNRYTQERVHVESLALELDVDPNTMTAVVDFFCTPHSYLVKETAPGRPGTVAKVAHESLIRGWERFRKWIDKEGERFSTYREVLDRCKHWAGENRARSALLDSGTLRRVKLHNLNDAFRPQRELSRRLKGLVKDLGDADRYAGVLENVNNYFDESVTHGAWKKVLVGCLLVFVVVISGLLAMQQFDREVERRYREREKQLLDHEAGFQKSYAIASATRKPMGYDFEWAIDAYQPLLQVLTASRLLAESARTYPEDRGQFDEVRRERFDRERWLAEAEVVGMLEAVLKTAVWRQEDGSPLDRRNAENLKSGTQQQTTSDRSLAYPGNKQVRCGGLGGAQGYYFPKPSSGDTFGLFLVLSSKTRGMRSSASRIDVYHVERREGRCTVKDLVVGVEGEGAGIGIKPDLAALVADVPRMDVTSRQFIRLEWSGNRISRKTSFSLTGLKKSAPHATQNRIYETGSAAVPVNAEEDIAVGSERYRLFSFGPGKRDPGKNWQQLSDSAPSSCKRLKAFNDDRSGALQNRTYYGGSSIGEGDEWCVELIKIPDDTAKLNPGYVVRVYAVSSMPKDWKHGPIAVSTINLGNTAGASPTIYMGLPSSESEGWLKVEFNLEGGKDGKDVFVSPWSRTAWTKIGCEVLKGSGYFEQVQSHGIRLPELQKRPLQRFREEYDYISRSPGGLPLDELERRICNVMAQQPSVSANLSPQPR